MMLESVYLARCLQVVLIIVLSGMSSFAETTSNNFPTYEHPKYSNRTCYKCPPGFYKVEDCQETRHHSQHPQWPTCSPCSESLFSHGWNTDAQCWDNVPRSFVKSQVDIHPGKTTRTAKCGCPGSTIEDETGNCVDAISMKDNLAMIKEIEEESRVKASCKCTEVIPQSLCEPCHDRTEWLPIWVVGLIGMGLGLLIALGIFSIYSGCQKCRRKVHDQREYRDSGVRQHVCIAVTPPDNTPRSQRQETQRSMDISAEIDDTNYPSGVHTRPRCSAATNRGAIHRRGELRSNRPDAFTRQDGHVHYGSLDSRQSLVHSINEGRQDPHHRSLPILFSYNLDPVESLRIPAVENFEHRFVTPPTEGQPDLRAGQSGSHMPVQTGGSMEQAQTCDVSSTFRQGVEVEIPTSDAQQEASSILCSDESTKPMVVYDTTVAGDAARETQRQRRTLETECERVKDQDGSVECFHIDAATEAPDNGGKAAPARELCGSLTSLKDIEDVECLKPSDNDIISMTEQKFEPANCEVIETSPSSEKSDVKVLKLTNDVTSCHEPDISSEIGSPFHTGEIYSIESKSEYKPGAMVLAFMKQTIGNFYKSLKKNEQISVPVETI